MTEAAPRTATLPSRGDEVDRYRVLGEIATGGMAAVFAAQRKSLAGFERLVALKVILPHLAADRYFVDMFLDEARIASRVHHANVIQVFDVVEHDGLPCIVMELLGGRSFAALLKEGERVPVAYRLLVLARVAEGLHAAHGTVGADGEPLGIVHRDVSPDNVHVGYDGHVKVVDFGIAAARGRLSSTRTGELKGKLAYLSPEQITSSPDINEKVDVWGLAVMAWEALAGERLFVGDGDAGTMWNVVHRPVPDIAEHAPGVSPDVAAAIMAGLTRDPHERIAMPELARTLSKAAVEGGATAAELAALMQDLFAEDKRAAEQRLEHTLSSAGAPAASTPSDAPARVEPSPIAESPPPAQRRWPLVLAATAGLALAATLAQRSLVDEAPVEVTTDPAPAADVAKAPEPEPPPPEPVVEDPTALDPDPQPVVEPAAPEAEEAEPPPAAEPKPRKKTKRRRPSKSKAAERGKLLDSPYGN